MNKTETTFMIFSRKSATSAQHTLLFFRSAALLAEHSLNCLLCLFPSFTRIALYSLRLFRDYLRNKRLMAVWVAIDCHVPYLPACSGRSHLRVRFCCKASCVQARKPASTCKGCVRFPFVRRRWRCSLQRFVARTATVAIAQRQGGTKRHADRRNEHNSTANMWGGGKVARVVLRWSVYSRGKPQIRIGSVVSTCAWHKSIGENQGVWSMVTKQSKKHF